MIVDRRQFSARLKRARQDARLKQEQVARYLQIPTSAVSAFEAGQRKLDAIELFMLSKLYQKPMTWFFNEVAENVSSDGDGSKAPFADIASEINRDQLMAECFRMIVKAPKNMQRSAMYGVIGFLSER